MEFQVKSINVGRAKKDVYKGNEIETGIYKQPIYEKSLFVSFTQIEGDEQADLINHGGKDKAICMYPFEHYLYWQKALPGVNWIPSAFGENLTIAGMTEENTCIGDIFEIGEVLVQVSQPRQPCYKLANKLKQPTLPVKIHETGFSGFYFRVLREGTIQFGQNLKLVERNSEKESISFVNQILYHDKENKEALRKLIGLTELVEGVRSSFEKRLLELSS